MAKRKSLFEMSTQHTSSPGKFPFDSKTMRKPFSRQDTFWANQFQNRKFNERGNASTVIKSSGFPNTERYPCGSLRGYDKCGAWF